MLALDAPVPGRLAPAIFRVAPFAGKALPEQIGPTVVDIVAADEVAAWGEAHAIAETVPLHGSFRRSGWHGSATWADRSIPPEVTYPFAPRHPARLERKGNNGQDSFDSTA